MNALFRHNALFSSPANAARLASDRVAMPTMYVMMPYAMMPVACPMMGMMGMMCCAFGGREMTT